MPLVNALVCLFENRVTGYLVLMPPKKMAVESQPEPHKKKRKGNGQALASSASASYSESYKREKARDEAARFKGMMSSQASSSSASSQ